MTRSAEEAVTVALNLVGSGVYQLGTGNNNTPVGGKSDCAGFAICKCYDLVRHRPGFNVGPWATVSDDLNCNSAIEDAEHKRELFDLAESPKRGDLLAYPTFWSKGKRFIGHIAIVVGVPVEWVSSWSRWAELDVVQCAGPNGRKPGIVLTNASHWDWHDRTWPKPQHRSKLLRVKQ